MKSSFKAHFCHLDTNEKQKISMEAKQSFVFTQEENKIQRRNRKMVKTIVTLLITVMMFTSCSLGLPFFSDGNAEDNSVPVKETLYVYNRELSFLHLGQTEEEYEEISLKHLDDGSFLITSLSDESAQQIHLTAEGASEMTSSMLIEDGRLILTLKSSHEKVYYDEK